MDKNNGVSHIENAGITNSEKSIRLVRSEASKVRNASGLRNFQGKARSGLEVEQSNTLRTITVTGAFPQLHCQPGVLVEIIRDPKNPGRMAFLRWQDGTPMIVQSIEYNGTIFVPPDSTSTSWPSLSLPDELLPYGELYHLLSEIYCAISKFVKLRPGQATIIAAFLLASWFPECFEAAVYLWIIGPLGSGKTKLLKLLWCLCRRGLIAGDVRSGSLYKMVDTWFPTLILDEVEIANSAASAELLRLLRTGSSAGVPAVRNGQQFSTYGMKIIASRQPLDDAALLSRGLVISMVPSGVETLPLDEAAMQKLQQEFQPKLLMFRLKIFGAVKNFRTPQLSCKASAPG